MYLLFRLFPMYKLVNVLCEIHSFIHTVRWWPCRVQVKYPDQRRNFRDFSGVREWSMQMQMLGVTTDYTSFHEKSKHKANRMKTKRNFCCRVYRILNFFCFHSFPFNSVRMVYKIIQEHMVLNGTK